jgi:cell division protein FtsQ
MAMDIERPGSTSVSSLPRGVVAALLSLAALLGTALAVHLLRPHFDLPLTALRIDGELQRLSAAQIASAAALSPGVHLFDADLISLRARVEQLPWVAHARVSRLWPDRITIRVWERVPVARWGDAGLVDSESHAFTPAANEIPEGLPQLSGPEGREADVVTAYRSLKAVLEGSRFAPVSLALDARGEWTALTADGIALHFGSEDPAASAPMLLGPATRALAEHLDQIASIDLHYSNGFAVGWKGGIAPFGKPAKTKPSAAVVAPPTTDKEPPL